MLSAGDRTGTLRNVRLMLIQGVSRETHVFEINFTPLIFSVAFIYYHEMIRHYMPF